MEVPKKEERKQTVIKLKPPIIPKMNNPASSRGELSR
jgi:hypothetical protein